MLKNMKLASKLAVVIGGILTIIFVVLIMVTALLSGAAISESISGELEAIAKSNGTQIQEIFDAANTAAQDMQSYLEKSYRIMESDPAQMVLPTVPEAMHMCQSSIYVKLLSPLNYDVEQYISETARNTAVNNADVAGVGAMFEPYKFQEDIRDYAFYVDQTNASGKIEPFGSYETYSKESYYQEAAEKKRTVVTKPYDYNGMKLVSYAMPILYNSELQGVVMADINVNNFNKVDATSERYKTMYATIYDSAGTIVYDSEDLANAGKTMSQFMSNQDELAAVQSKMTQNTAFQVETTREDGRKVSRFFSPIQAGDETWWSLTAVDSTDVNEAVTLTVLWLVGLSAAALLLIILVVVGILKWMLKPMQAVVQAAESIAGGNLHVQLQSQSGDEIGVLSHSFQEMSENLRSIISDTDYLLSEMGDGNFQVKSRETERYIGDYAGLLEAARKINSSLSDTLSQINQSADQVSSGSEQVSSGAQALSQGATEQAASVEELAATINEISQQIKGTAENAASARRQTENAGEEITACNQQMQNLIEAMAEISGKSNEIGKIIKTIEDIAFQTNILALNAAVEAARAGAAGKGFAVVADEVRSLANKSQVASKDTSALIAGSIQAVEKGTLIANETAQSLSQVVNGAQGVAVTVDKIAAAAEEQAGAIAQVTLGIDQISSVVQTNSATAEESAAASEELSGQAQLLRSLVGRFRLKDAVKTAPVLRHTSQSQEPVFSQEEGFKY